MNKALIRFFGFALTFCVSAGAWGATKPAPWDQMGPAGFQPPPGTWEFRPPRQPRSMNFGYSDQANRNRPFSFNFGGPGAPQMSFFGPGQGQPFGQPSTQHYAQPRMPGFDPRQTQRYTPPYQSSRPSNQPPRIEVALSNDHPYTQESSIYTLRVVSDSNIKTIDVDLPRSDTVAFQKLDGPAARVRTHRGNQEIVNEFHYTLTPLRAGYIELPPVRVSGTMASTQNGYTTTQGKSFDVKAERGLRLDVRPADPSLQPWLPLQHLSLRAGLQGEDKIEAGKPITLWVEASAVGGTASRLPSLESQLKSTDFRVYREKTQNRSEISQDGHYLHGVRTEYFTLVPQRAGNLQLPPLRIAWWNVNTGSLQYASLPLKPLRASGETPGAGFLRGMIPATSPFPAGSSSVFWVPLAAIFGIFLGYWLAVWLRNRNQPEAQRKTLPLMPALAGLRKPARAALDRVAQTVQRLSPRPMGFLGRLSDTVAAHWQRLYEKLVFALPKSLRFWFCVRCARKEPDPDRWGRKILDDANRHLDLPANSPLPEIANKIVELHPRRNTEALQGLMQQLDRAIYGSEQLDFERWKRDFRRQVRPSLFSRIRNSGTRPRRYLPELNPKAA